MSLNLRNRSLLTIADLNPSELLYLLDLAHDLKRAKYSKTEQQHLKGKNIALIFEKPSTRTRCAFEVACFDQGANVSYLEPSGSQMGHKETIQDTARVLGRLYDGIEYRGSGQTVVETLAKYAGVPVYNGLTAESHPTQVLADLMTMREYSDKPLHDISFCFVGDCRFNMANSLLIGGCTMGMDVRLSGPKQYLPDAEIETLARDRAKQFGASLMVTENLLEAVKDVDFIYTDVWVSMGEPSDVWVERIQLLKPYQVTSLLLNATGNPRTKFMHCLPAFHNRNTTIGSQIFQQFGLEAMEVTDEVFESSTSIVFDQAENRMHTIKALLVATLGD
ncbi:MAG: ornithine carbamoyltransferase [Leptolyngbyaceae cyanobacterium SL_5_9]|nr:ornithine carbamoyltransferase [Leptolyngbyaceae cyanobacterium SL_5_9]NJO73589.1 ornithine carbamoyltransferase [Leptolyngbyaceae cyanobacterium RM1_406_9]